MSWLRRLVCPRPVVPDPIADAKNARIDMHIANQAERISLIGEAVDRNERAAAEMLRRLKEDIPR